MCQEEIRKIHDYGMEKFGTLLVDSSERAIAVVGNRWWPQAAKQEGDKISSILRSIYLVC